jgi:uncharacterized protein (DUF983 family)
MALTIFHLLNNKCPNCHKGNIFKDKSLFRFWFPKMNDHCSHCETKFNKEPGYFFGAMYVNYALNVAQGITTYFLAKPFFTETFDLRMFPIIAGVLLLLTFFNIRLSRLVWIYIFRNYAT